MLDILRAIPWEQLHGAWATALTVAIFYLIVKEILSYQPTEDDGQGN